MINRILIPIDFSESSKNQLKYGLSLGIKAQAEIHVLHIYQLPVVSLDAFVYVPDPENLEKIRSNFISQLFDLIKDVKFELKTDISVAIECQYGIPSDLIKSYAIENNCNLIVMGLQGSGYLTERILGSTTTHLFRNAPVPILGIHKSSHFVQIQNILFAYDGDLLVKKNILEPLIDLSKIFNAKIHVLNVVEELSEFPDLAEKLFENDLSPSLPQDSVSYHIIQKNDILEGIQEYCENNDIDLLTLIPKKHNILERISSESISKQVAYHIKIPILAIHE
ncbi:MAG: universal stress protein [Saprospiraceae bacterium]|nr:universal stress protein [Saprospiraceae bacterium]